MNPEDLLSKLHAATADAREVTYSVNRMGYTIDGKLYRLLGHDAAVKVGVDGAAAAISCLFADPITPPAASLAISTLHVELVRFGSSLVPAWFLLSHAIACTRVAVGMVAVLAAPPSTWTTIVTSPVAIVILLVCR